MEIRKTVLASTFAVVFTLTLMFALNDLDTATNCGDLGDSVDLGKGQLVD